LKFWISTITIFFEKKNYSFADTIQLYPYNTTIQKI